MTDPPLTDPVPPEQLADARRTVAALITAQHGEDAEGWAALGQLTEDEMVLMAHQAVQLAAALVQIHYGPLGEVEDFLDWFRRGCPTR